MYMQSNEPYHRVENDSVWSGAMIGGALGGAGAAAAHFGGQKAIGFMRNKADSSLEKSLESAYDDMAKSSKNPNLARYEQLSEKANEKFMKRNDRLDSASKWHKKRFGGGTKSKAFAYAGSVIAGGLGGMAIDAMNRPG